MCSNTIQRRKPIELRGSASERISNLASANRKGSLLFRTHFQLRGGEDCRKSGASQLSGDPKFTVAQQGARANVHIGHASCNRFSLGIEAANRKSEFCTSHARCGRGSSLTLGKT